MSVAGVLFDILVVLIAAKLAGEISERIGIPPVVGEIAAGILVGRSVLGVVGDDEVLRVFAELGVILLLVEVGMEMDPAELRRVGRPALRVAVAGVVAPFISGYLVSIALGIEQETAIFLGAALTATSVGITARVFGDLKVLATNEARTVLGAAIADDVIGLVILTVVAGTAAAVFSIATVASVTAIAISVLLLSYLVGRVSAPWLIEQVQRLSRSRGTLLGVVLAFILVFSLIADAAGLAPIVGAFVAGLTLARSTESDRIKAELAPIGHLFIPVFFLQIGIDVELDRFVGTRTLSVAGGLLAVGIIGKLVSGWAVGRMEADRLLIGIGMLPRGEVGLIFAGLGLREGLLGSHLYGALLLVVFVTTIVTPPLLRWRIRNKTPAPKTSVVPPGLRTNHPLILSDGMVELGTSMPPGRALDVTLEAALALADGHQPGPRLLDEVASLTAPSLRWDDASIEGLFRVLRYGNARSWKFLETSTVLDRVLPELAEVLRKRRSDRHELDATRAFRWTLLERLHECIRIDEAAAAEFYRLEKPDLLLLSALVLDATDDRREAIKLGRRLSGRLSLGAPAEQLVAILCGSSNLMSAALRRPDALESASLLPVAAHIARPEVARGLYLISLLRTDLDSWQRSRLDELHQLVHSLLTMPDGNTPDLIERRRETAVASCNDKNIVRWIAGASPSHLLSCGADDLVRHARLMERASKKRRLELELMAEGSRGWLLEIAAPDSRGLLARTAGVLAAAAMNVESAIVATTDGIALQSFHLSGPPPPLQSNLQTAFERALHRPLESRAILGADISFDDAGSPWATLCEVRAPDREGLLHSVATAIALTGVNVRAASVATQSGQIVDRFELVGKDGRKLSSVIKAQIEEGILAGVAPSKRRVIPRLARVVGRSV